MSKKVLVFSIAVLFGAQAGLAMAANPDTGQGCGLGKLVWADYKGQKEIAPQVLQATTNGTGMNTFGISSGTSGCTNDGKIMSEYKTTVFASLNFDALSAEMAQGRGEHLASLATLMGVPEERHPVFHPRLAMQRKGQPLAQVRPQHPHHLGPRNVSTGSGLDGIVLCPEPVGSSVDRSLGLVRRGDQQDQWSLHPEAAAWLEAYAGHPRCLALDARHVERWIGVRRLCVRGNTTELTQENECEQQELLHLRAPASAPSRPGATRRAARRRCRDAGADPRASAWCSSTDRPAPGR